MGMGLRMRLGLGSGSSGPAELFTNGNFNSDISGWTTIEGSGASWSAGRLRADASGGNVGVGQVLPLIAGGVYRFSGLVVSLSGGSWFVKAGPSVGLNYGDLDAVNYNTGSFSYDFTATGGASSYVGIRMIAPDVGVFDNFSLIRLS